MDVGDKRARSGCHRIPTSKACTPTSGFSSQHRRTLDAHVCWACEGCWHAFVVAYRFSVGVQELPMPLAVLEVVKKLARASCGVCMRPATDTRTTGRHKASPLPEHPLLPSLGKHSSQYLFLDERRVPSRVHPGIHRHGHHPLADRCR